MQLLKMVEDIFLSDCILALEEEIHKKREIFEIKVFVFV